MKNYEVRIFIGKTSITPGNKIAITKTAIFAPAPSSSAKNNPFDNVFNTTITTPPAAPPKATTAQTSQSKTTASPPSQILVNNSLLTNPLLQPHLAFLRALSQEHLNALAILGQQGINLNHLLPTLTDYKATQADLTQRLQAVELHTGLDTQSQAEIAYIQKNENLNRYYQVLKMLLGQTFLAAKVISSGDVDASQGTTATVVNGISTVAGALCPPAAPFLGFAATVVGIADGIDSYRAAQTLSDWIDLQYIAQLAESIARQLTIAQELSLTRGLTPQGQGMIRAIQNKCSLIVERIKSGQVLNTQESRALLDANELLSYMKANYKPRNADLPQCVAILLTVIMGDGYVHIHPLTQQTSAVTINATTVSAGITATTQTHTITREEWEAIQKETAEAKRKAEEAARNADSVHKELETLRKKSAQSNPGSSHTHDNGDGTVSLQQQEQMINTSQGPMPLSTFLKTMQSQIAALEGGMGTTNQIVYKLQETLKVENDDEILNEQMRNDLFQGSNFSFQ